MGNLDSFSECFAAQGSAEIVDFKGGYFSFAFGNEIALIVDDLDEYFILNCNRELFDEVKRQIGLGKSKKQLSSFWKKNQKLMKYLTGLLILMIWRKYEIRNLSRNARKRLPEIIGSELFQSCRF